MKKRKCASCGKKKENMSIHTEYENGYEYSSTTIKNYICRECMLEIIKSEFRTNKE